MAARRSKVREGIAKIEDAVSVDGFEVTGHGGTGRRREVGGSRPGDDELEFLLSRVAKVGFRVRCETRKSDRSRGGCEKLRGAKTGMQATVVGKKICLVGRREWRVGGISVMGSAMKSRGKGFGAI